MGDSDLALGGELLRTGDIMGALAAFQRAVAHTPDTADAHYGLGLALLGCRQPGEAARAFQRATELDPQSFAAYNNLGLALMAQGSGAGAIRAFEQSLALCPDNPRAWYNLGNARRDRGEPSRALDAYRRAVTLDGDYAKARNNLGALLLERGRPAEALDELRAAVALAPRFAEAQNNLGLAEWQTGDLDEAARAFRQALACAPGFVDSYLNLSDVLKTQDRIEEARAVLTQAREHAPEHVGVLGKLAALLEETGSHETAEGLVRRALALEPGDAFLALTAAKCERRWGDFQAAIDRLKRATEPLEDTELSGVVRKELGTLYDRIGEYSLAFQNIQAGNALLERHARAQGVAAEDFVSENDAVCVPLMDKPKVGVYPENAPERPVFLVGFPRSGTTLLNQVLDNHPRLQSLEEKPAVDALVRAAAPRADIASDLADAGTLARLRSAYFRVVEQSLERAPGTHLVDKYPLNILRMPLIYRVFPGAKVLLALRHPCDVCLSCYMQSFKLNSAMASFLSLEQTARLYVLAMRRWQWCATNLGMDVHVVRYESLVDEFEDQVQSVLQFLGLPWDDKVLEHVEGAKRRGRINTPSYHQVAQPIYRRAVYRWRHYAEHLRSILPMLAPFIEDFGYD